MLSTSVCTLWKTLQPFWKENNQFNVEYEDFFYRKGSISTIGE
jgi:hypothetical protein